MTRLVRVRGKGPACRLPRILAEIASPEMLLFHNRTPLILSELESCSRQTEINPCPRPRGERDLLLRGSSALSAL